MASPAASAVLIGRLVLAGCAKAAATGIRAVRSRREKALTRSEQPDYGADGEALAIAWQRFSDIILAMNARNPEVAHRELLSVSRLSDSCKVKLMAYVLFCTRRRVRELAGLRPTAADLSALVAAHIEDYQKVIHDDGIDFYSVLKVFMPGNEKTTSDKALVFGSGALGVLLPEGTAAAWLAAIQQDAWNWAVRAEQNDPARGVELYRTKSADE